ncbi:unnamed protein product, partial [Choristocarpus tenellus]
DAEEWRALAEAVMAGTQESQRKKETVSRRCFAVVCSSNINRSIMAQKVLEENAIRVRSYGAAREVRLPGKDAKTPKSFAFGTPYLEIHDELKREDAALFQRNSVLSLLARDAVTKRSPERWQDAKGKEVSNFDIVVCFETRVFDLVVEGIPSCRWM